jgi:hypothetical protein
MHFLDIFIELRSKLARRDILDEPLKTTRVFYRQTPSFGSQM